MLYSYLIAGKSQNAKFSFWDLSASICNTKITKNKQQKLCIIIYINVLAFYTLVCVKIII